MKTPRVQVSPKRSVVGYRPGPGNRFTARRPLSALNKSTSAGKPTKTIDVSAQRNNIKVIVRVRPPNRREQASRIIVAPIPENLIVFDPPDDEEAFYFHGVKQTQTQRSKHKNLRMAFDKVFHGDDSNSFIFEDVMMPAIDSLLAGYNCSVFAYGQTGSGKTYTMLGSPENPGLTLLTVAELFKRISQMEDSNEVKLSVSYLEVYNETVKDLLNMSSGELNVREDNNGVVTVPKLSFHEPKDATELLQLLTKGNSVRSQHPTDLNAESSRSHAVFQVMISMRGRYTGTSSRFTRSKLVMIDLAGSERGTATGFAGQRFREGASINCSLLALGNCINALASGKKHIPYRNSKLTRILKDSLGGKSKTIMIANVSPSSMSFEETYQTLKYADQAKRIKCQAKKNNLSVNTCFTQYNKMLEEMSQKIASLTTELETTKKNCKCNKPCETKDQETVLSESFLELHTPCPPGNWGKENTFVVSPHPGKQNGYDYDRDILNQLELDYARTSSSLLSKSLQIKWKMHRIDTLRELAPTVPNGPKGLEKMKKQVDLLKKRYKRLLEKKLKCYELLRTKKSLVVRSPDTLSKLETNLHLANEQIRFYKESSQFLLEELTQNQELLMKSVNCLVPYHALALHYSSNKVKKEYEDLISALFCARVRWANDTSSSTPVQEAPSGVYQQLLDVLNKPIVGNVFPDSHAGGDIKSGVARKICPDRVLLPIGANTSTPYKTLNCK